MPACSVKGCKNRTKSIKKDDLGGKIHFYTFPKNEEFCQTWLEACAQESINIKNARICSEHFLPSAYKEKTWVQQQLGSSPQRGRRLKDDAIPTEKLPSTSTSTRRISGTIESHAEIVASTTTHGRLLPAQSLQLDTELNHFEMTRPLHSFHETCNTENVPPTNSENSHITPGSKDQENKDTTKEQSILEKENEILKRKNIILLRKLRNQKKEIKTANDMNEKNMKILKKMFTPGQIHLLLHPEKSKTIWTAEDISAALSLHSVSPRAYRFLKDVLQMPLPSFSTLRRWIDKLNMDKPYLSMYFP